MRQACETCGQLQPPDWQPGDLCGHCGAVVRREKRCHWCVQLTPEGKFCRRCGAGLVPDEQYGAARWLKHLGSDQFVIPGRLREMDPEQVEHFERLYQRHAVVAERHLDDCALAESYLRQRGWARALENELLPRLPLPADELTALTLPPRRGLTDAEKLAEVVETSPFALTRQLAALAGLRLWQQGAELWEVAVPFYIPAHEALKPTADPALQTEAALTLSHWRMVVRTGSLPDRLITPLLYKCRDSAFGLEAETALQLIKARQSPAAQPVPPAALGADDPDLAFAAALAQHEPEALRAALRVPVRRFAAANMLTKAGLEFDLAGLLPQLPYYEASDLLNIIYYQERPRPDLRAYLLRVLAGRVELERSVLPLVPRLLARDPHPGDAAWLLRTYPDAGLATQLLRHPALPPAEVAELCAELVQLNLFYPPTLSQLTEVFRAGTLPLSFVPAHFRAAPDTSRFGLETLARQQFDAPAGLPAERVALYGFFQALLWDESAPPPQRQTAFNLLGSLDGGNAASGRPPLGFSEAGAAPYFGSLAAYVTAFTHGLDHLAALTELGAAYEFLRPLEALASPTDGPAELLALPTPLLARLQQALAALAANPQTFWHARKAAVQVLAQLLAHAPLHEGIHAQLLALRELPELDWVVDEALGVA